MHKVPLRSHTRAPEPLAGLFYCVAISIVTHDLRTGFAIPAFQGIAVKIVCAFLKIMTAKADGSCILETTYFKEVFFFTKRFLFLTIGKCRQREQSSPCAQ